MDDRPLDDITRSRLSELEEAPPFPSDAIRERVRDTIAQSRSAPHRSRSLRPLLAATAALVFFVGGAFFGRWTARTPVPRPQTGPSVEASLPIEIQAEGTEYVAAVNRFADVAASLTPEEREQARDVALAVLYGAALELLRHRPDDDVAAIVYESVSRQRRPHQAEVVWF